MDPLLTVTTWLSVILIAGVLISVRRAHIRVENAVSWLMAGVVLLVLSLSHDLLQRIAGFIGLANGPSALLLLTGVVFVVVIFRLSIRISNLNDSNIKLAQKIAILEFHLERVHEEGKTQLRPN